MGIFVGTGVIGEYLFGFCIAVGEAAYANTGSVGVGTLASGAESR